MLLVIGHGKNVCKKLYETEVCGNSVLSNVIYCLYLKKEMEFIAYFVIFLLFFSILLIVFVLKH